MIFHHCVADGVCIQSLEHPGCVWDAKFLDNGDIVTACSDGVVRVWTTHQDKIADPAELESYAAQLSQYKLSRFGIQILLIRLSLLYFCGLVLALSLLAGISFCVIYIIR